MNPDILVTPKLVFTAISVILTLIIYAYLENKVKINPYDYKGELPVFFNNFPFIVLCCRMFSVLFSIGAIAFQGDILQLKVQAPTYKYFLISISNVLAIFFKKEAFKSLSSPMQTLSMSCIMIPVMIWSTIMFQTSKLINAESEANNPDPNVTQDEDSRVTSSVEFSSPSASDSAHPISKRQGKVYGPLHYLIACLVALGCTIFLVSRNPNRETDNQSSSLSGLILILCFLALDGFSSNFREKLFSGYNMSIFNQMLYVHIFSAMMSLILLFLDGQVMESFQFAIKHPNLIHDISIMSFSAIASEVAILVTIKDFGALTYATIMSIRHFVIAFLSSIVFRHGMTPLQWLGTIIVVGSLIMKSSYLK